ncbi:MAG: hypothetical protein PWP31_881 [Clostridia bacterium]|nr:hypothetical protein [Clostridia bacterium]
MAIVEATIVPIGTSTTSVSKYVADCHKVLQDVKDIKYMLTPMGTIFEGELDAILEVIRKMHEIPFKEGAMRVSTMIKIDDRRDKKGTMEQKLNSVKEKLDM